MSGKGASMAPHQDTTRVLADAGVRPDGTASATGVEPGLAAALHEVSAQLDAPGLTGGERMRLLQRQAELGDLRDELDLRARRRLGSRR